MTADDYTKKNLQKPIGGFKDPTGKYDSILCKLQAKFRLKTRADLMKKLIDDGQEIEQTKERLETAIRYNENTRKTYQKWKSRHLWFLGFNLFLLLIHILYSVILK